VRRKFHEIHEDQKRLPGTLAEQALLRIAQLYAIETPIRGRPPDERRGVRRAQSRVLMDELHRWLQGALAQVSAKSALAKAIGYVSTRWTALTRYLDDGRIEMACSLQAIRVAVAGPPRHFVKSWEREAKFLVHERFAEQTDEISVLRVVSSTAPTPAAFSRLWLLYHFATNTCAEVWVERSRGRLLLKHLPYVTRGPMEQVIDHIVFSLLLSEDGNFPLRACNRLIAT
jgi:hypothetical protein